MRILSTAAIATLAIAGVANALGNSSQYQCSGAQNTAPVLDLPAVSLKNVTNGQSWKMEQDTNFVYIARLQGTPYEMGYAYGQLFGAEIAKNFENLLSYGYTKVTSVLEKFGISSVMSYFVWTQLQPALFYLADLNYQISLPYVPQRFLDELKGIADGSNGTVNEVMLRRANWLPELIQAACSIVGSYGSASKDGKLYHLRALDWEPTAPVNEFPSVIFYEPSEEGSHAFANIGYLGMIGTLTSISKVGISVGEKVMYADPKDYPVPPHITYYGKPW